MSENPEAEYDVVVEADLLVPMRDGVRLRTSVYRPPVAGRFPVLVSRYPYEPLLEVNGSAAQLARQGYVAVVQHSRGRFGSEGDFDALREVDDGYDAIEWAAVQPWSNGRVGTYGMSYGGFTQWAAAIARPPHLVAISPMSSGWSYFGSNAWYFAPGVLALGIALNWCASMAQWEAAKLESPGLSPEPITVADLVKRAIEAGPVVPPGIFDRRPLRELAELELAPWWKDWCDHDDPSDPYWRSISAADNLDKIDVPALHIVGWYDYFTKSTLDAFVTLTRAGANEKVRDGQRLVIGPWTHSSNSAMASLSPRPDLPVDLDPLLDFEKSYAPGSHLVRFFEHHLKGENPKYAEEPSVRLYVMGENLWRDEWEWPLARTQFTAFHLHSGGSANTVDGDGRLEAEPPSAQPADSFTFDPADPVPGSLGLGPAMGDPVDLKAVGDRADVLVYTTSPLEHDLEVTGPVRLELWVSSSAVDTDFTAKLIDVFADGTPVPLCQGVVRASAANGGPINPGEIYRLEIDLWATSNLFKKGHRIRLDVSSSEFPLYELNPNTGSRITQDASGHVVKAAQTIFHDDDHPSRLILPVIPR